MALLPKTEVRYSEILHEDLAFQRLGCRHFKFIWLYRNREIFPGLMHKRLLPHSEGLCQAVLIFSAVSTTLSQTL